MTIQGSTCRQYAILFILLFAGRMASAQDLVSKDRTVSPVSGVKSNLLYDVTGTINLGAEFRITDRLSFELPVNWNPFTFSDNRKWKHVLVQPEFRLWTKKVFSGHFFGVHAHYAFYNVGNLPKPFSSFMRDHRFEGWLAGAGVSYGYRWNLSRHWGLEATIGAGYAYMDYEKFQCIRCGESLSKDNKHYFGPTKVGLSLIYNIGKKKQPAPVQVYTPPVVIEQKQKVVVLPYTPQYVVSYVVPDVEEVKVRSEAGKAYLDFAVGRADIVPSFKGNVGELEKIYAMIRKVRANSDATITGMIITGFASPEGTYQSNLSLSQRRAASLKDQIQKVTGLTGSFYTVEGKGEDWAMLDTLVSQSGMADKYTILEIVRGTDIFDGRERKLMELSAGNPYREMKANLFPQLRRTEYELHYTVLPFTVEKGKEMMRTNPGNLSLNEMFLVANTYTPGSDAFNEVFETAARLFLQDDTAKLNAAASALSRGDTVQAASYLLKVREQSGAYHNNMGVLYGLRKEWDKAAESFRKAQLAGAAEADQNFIGTQKSIESRKAANGKNLLKKHSNYRDCNHIY